MARFKINNLPTVGRVFAWIFVGLLALILVAILGYALYCCGTSIVTGTNLGECFTDTWCSIFGIAQETATETVPEVIETIIQ